MRLFLLIVVSIFSLPSYAELNVESYNAEKKRVSLKGSELEVKSLNPGYRLTLKISDEKSCDLEVLEKKDLSITADATLCPFKSEITPGQSAFKTGTELPSEAANTSADETETSSKSVASSNYRFNFEVGLTYSTASEFETEGTIDPAGTEFEGEFESVPAAGVSFGFSYRKDPSVKWFVNGGVLFEFARKIDRERLNGSIVNTGKSSQSELNYMAAYGNVAYEVATPLYLTAGIGIGIGVISDYQPEIESSMGGLAQAGIGVHFAEERFFLELLGRYQSFSAERDNITSITKYNTISATGALIHFRARVF